MKRFARQIVPKLSRLKHTAIKNYADRAGYNLALKSDYYSPLNSVSELRSTFDRWHKPSAMKGIEYDLEEMKNALSDLLERYLAEFSRIPPYEHLQKMGFGPGYTAVDALTLYMMIRQTKPKRYIEIGSGLSTYYCSLAAAQNAAEGHPLAITCIEPYPFEEAIHHSGNTYHCEACTRR